MCHGSYYVRASIGVLTVCECWYDKGGMAESYERHSGLGGELRAKTFSTFHARPELTAAQKKTLNHIFVYCRDFATSQVERPWLLMGGSFGWGKSHLAQAIVNERAADPGLGAPGYFVMTQQVLQDLRDSYDEGSYMTVLRRYKEIPLLVLDDLGATANKKTDADALSWVDEQMLTILDHRSSNRMETVITLNVPLKSIEPRLRDRINDTGTGLCQIFAEELPSYRTGAVQE